MSQRDIAACDDECTQRSYAPIAAALSIAQSEPRRALVALRAERSRIAHAWAAVIALDLGDRDALARETALLGERAEENTAEGAAVSERTSLLREIRLAVDHEDVERRALVVPCWVFERYGREALVAFAAYHGSTLDGAARSHKQRCLDAIVSRAAAPAQQAQFRASMSALEEAVFAVVPVPQDGTLWVGLSIAAADSLYDAAIAPDTVSTTPGSLPDAVRALSSSRRGLAARVRAFERRQQQHLPAFAAGLCAHARALGRPMTTEACAHAARAASDASLAQWLRSVHDP